MPISVILTSEEKDHPKLKEVKEVLESIPGKYFSFTPKKELDDAFIALDADKVMQREEDFFDTMNEYRRSRDLGNSEYLVFLTSRKIPGGFFNGIQFEHKNIFVDIENWKRQFLQESPDRYPIAFHVWISVLINHYFPDKLSAQKALHFKDKGCILDFNKYKTKVDLKILTARICPDCLDTLLQYNPDPNLLAYFRHGIERIRQEIVNGEYYERIKPEPVRVTLKEAKNKKINYQLEFEGIGTLELDAAHLIVYINFLRKKGGMKHYQIRSDYKFLLNLYGWVSGKLENQEKTIAKLCKLKIENGVQTDVETNALNERISFINKQLTKLLGTFGLQEFYQILQRDNYNFGISHRVEFRDDSGVIQNVEKFLAKKL